jgi:hypothetical protein
MGGSVIKTSELQSQVYGAYACPASCRRIAEGLPMNVTLSKLYRDLLVATHAT